MTGLGSPVLFELGTKKKWDGGPEHVWAQQELEVVLHVVFIERHFWPVYVQLFAVALFSSPAYHYELQSGFAHLVAFLRHRLVLPVRKVNIRGKITAGLNIRQGCLSRFCASTLQLSAEM